MRAKNYRILTKSFVLLLRNKRNNNLLNEFKEKLALEIKENEVETTVILVIVRFLHCQVKSLNQCLKKLNMIFYLEFLKTVKALGKTPKRNILRNSSRLFLVMNYGSRSCSI